MANMEFPVLYKVEDSLHPLPQLSDEHLNLLNDPHESYDSQYPCLDNFDLEILNEKSFVSEAPNQINQNNQSYYESEFDQLIADQFSPQSDSNQYTCSFNPTSVESTTFTTQDTSFANQFYNEQIYSDNLSNQSSTNQFNSYLDETILNELTSSNELDINDFGDLNEFTGDLKEIDSLPDNQILCSPDYTNQFTNSPQSAGYQNQIIDYSVDNSPASTQFSNWDSTVYSPFDYQALNSPNSVQSSNGSSIDYSIQSTSTNVYPFSQSSSPLSNADSVESYENQDYPNYSTDFNQCYNNQYSLEPCESTLQTKKTATNKQSTKLASLEQKVKRKRAKKIVSEEELNRKLAIKLERKRKRLERKKVQNKEAAKRYREKKKLEEDEINKRLSNVKDNYKVLSEQLKETLNEKKVLLKLLKDFADQSSDIILPQWMRSVDFLNSLI